MHLSPAASPSSQMALFRSRDRWVRRWNVASTTDPERSYTVALDAAGELGCSCPTWVYDSERKPCKHIRRFRRRKNLRKPEISCA